MGLFPENKAHIRRLFQLRMRSNVSILAILLFSTHSVKFTGHFNQQQNKVIRAIPWKYMLLEMFTLFSEFSILLKASLK